MQTFLEWAIGLLVAGYIPLVGYAFKARADAHGYQVSYERERERVTDMVAVERDAKQAAAIGLAVAQAIGKIPPESGKR